MHTLKRTRCALLVLLYSKFWAESVSGLNVKYDCIDSVVDESFLYVGVLYRSLTDRFTVVVVTAETGFADSLIPAYSSIDLVMCNLHLVSSRERSLKSLLSSSTVQRFT